ncbi:MAG: 50S ribosomal protein L29 [Bacteroidetes bacterium]|nr:50S ribosomal protein L29 [Bacteroidota bacterium]
MKANQVRDMSAEDLKISLKDNFESLENLRFRHAIGQLENYKSLSNTKKDIARINTIIREKELKINENIKKVVKKSVKSPEKKVTKRKTKKAEVTEEAGTAGE